MNEPDRNDTFERRAHAAFEAGIARLDGATRSRLARARHAALAAAHDRSRWMSAWTWGLPAAAAAMLVLALLLNWRSTQVPVPATLEDLPIAFENLELLENVEFYAWLDQATNPGGEAGS